MQSCTIQYLLLVNNLSDVLLPTCHIAVKPLIERALSTLQQFIQFGNLRLCIRHLLSLTLQHHLSFRLYIHRLRLIFRLQLLQIGIQTLDLTIQLGFIFLKAKLLFLQMIYLGLVRGMILQSVQTLLTLLLLQLDALYLTSCHFKLFFKGCLYFSFLLLSFRHQHILLRERLSANCILSVLLQLLEAVQFRLNTIHQLSVFAGNVIVLSREVIKSLFLSLQQLLQHRFFIAPADDCVNTYTGIVFLLRLAGLDSVIHHTQLLVQGRFLRLILLHHLSKEFLLTHSFAIQFR